MRETTITGHLMVTRSLGDQTTVVMQIGAAPVILEMLSPLTKAGTIKVAFLLTISRIINPLGLGID